MTHINTEDNVADLLTKALPEAIHSKFTDKLMNGINSILSKKKILIEE
jgi:hypothetical protein